MTASSELDILTASVDGLTESIDALRAETQELHEYGRRNRTLIRRQWIIIAAVILLAVWLGFTALGARHAADIAKNASGLAQRNSANFVSQCQSGNNARAVTLTSWNTILSADFTSTLPPAQQAVAKARIAQLRDNLAKVLAPQDCSKLAP